MHHFLALAGILIALCTYPLYAKRAELVLFAALFASIFSFTRPLLDMSHGPYNGLASSGPRLTIYGLICFATLIYALRNPRELDAFRPFLPFLAVLVFGKFFLWDSSSLVDAGILQYVTGISALVAGAVLGKRITAEPSKIRGIARILACVVAVELVVGALQLKGYSINPVSANSAEFVAGRINGTTDHPNTLGKLLTLTLVLLLPLSQSADRGTRRLVNFSILGSLALIGLTGGRAGAIGATILVVLWIFFMPRAQRVRLNILIPASLGAACVVFAPLILARFREDPNGGSRDELTHVALAFISNHLWTSTGPNTYVARVGLIDPKTATGLPVHNAFLLTLSEVGILVAAAFWIPLIWLHLRGPKRNPANSMGLAYQRAVLFSFPAIFILVWTGWGMVSGSVFVLWLFVIGFAGAAGRTNKLISTAVVSRARPGLDATSPGSQG